MTVAALLSNKLGLEAAADPKGVQSETLNHVSWSELRSTPRSERVAAPPERADDLSATNDSAMMAVAENSGEDAP